MNFEASVASGCQRAECPCLNAPDATPDSTRCVRLGDKLVDVPQGWSDFERRSFAIYSKAAAEGRTYPDYASGIKLGRAYASHPWIAALHRIAASWGLILKPNTLSLWAADRCLIAPPAAPAAAPSALDAAPLRPLDDPSAGVCAASAAAASA